jgi:hypothetical protein
MPQQTHSLGATTYSPYSDQNTGNKFASQFKASAFYDSPVTGAIGVSSKPILVTDLSITSTSGGGYNKLFQQNDNQPNGFNGAEATTSDTLCYYGFQHTDDSRINFKRGDGVNPNGIWGNGVNPPSYAVGASPSWSSTSIAASITWKHIPNAPTNFVTTARTNTSITLDWGAPTDPGGASVEGYRVLYKVRNTSTDNTASSWTVKFIATASPTLSDRTITGLLSNTTYDFRVAATNDVTDAHSGGVYTSASAIVGANATLNSVTTDNVTITGNTIYYGILNKPYSGNISSTGTVTFGIVSGSLPPGLNLGTSSGFITGTPTTVGSYAFTIGLYSGGVLAASQAFTVVIYNSSPKVVTGTSPFATSRGTLKVYDSGWKDAYMRVYDTSYTDPDGTNWRPIS